MSEQTRKIIVIPPNPNLFASHPKIRACAYVRVSTEHAEQLNSLQNQIDYFEWRLQSNPTYEDCGIFSDAGVSGRKKERPGFQAMMEKARAGEIDLILTKSVSRFSRSTILLLESIRELKGLGVNVNFEQQNIYTLSMEGELLITLLASYAEEEQRSVSGNVRVAMRNKYKSGEGPIRLGLLIGYIKDADGNIVIEKAQAKIVRRIFRLYLEGFLPEHIAKVFNNEGIPTYSRNNPAWDYHRVRRILSNEKYAGDCCHLKYYNSEDGKTHRNRGEFPMYYVRNTHVPIISRSDWERVQRIMKSRKRVVHPYTGMLKCPYCSAVLHGHPRSDSDTVDWVCSTLLIKHKAACKGVRIEENLLKSLTAEILPLKESLIVWEEDNAQKDNNGAAEKNYRLIPVNEYKR